MMTGILMIGATALFCAGCTTHRFGDARIQNNRDFAGVVGDRFYLKPVPIDRAATHTLQGPKPSSADVPHARDAAADAH